jgi:hypothetical protein
MSMRDGYCISNLDPDEFNVMKLVVSSIDGVFYFYFEFVQCHHIGYCLFV